MQLRQNLYCMKVLAEAQLILILICILCRSLSPHINGFPTHYYDILTIYQIGFDVWRFRGRLLECISKNNACIN